MDAQDLQRETDALRRVARGVLFEPALAEDAVQEAWLAALRSQQREARSGGWLTEAVRRIARGMRRQESRRTRREHAAAQREAQPSASDSAARVELLRELLDALEALDEPYRTAVQLRLLDDLPPRAIAQRLGIPVETARTRVKRGIAELRARLDARHAHRRDEFLAALAGSKTLGVALMTAQAKLSIAAVLLLAAGLLWTHPWTPSAPEPAAEPRAELALAAPPERTAEAQPEPAELAAPAAAGSPRESLSAVAPGARWVVRGRALCDRSRPLPGAEIEIELVAGYDGPGETLQRASVRSAEDGSFALALAQPECALRVRARGTLAGCLGYSTEQLVLRGAEAPQALLVSFLTLDMRIAGHVLDQQGQPIAGAQVQGPGRLTVTSDAAGGFELQASSMQRSAHIDAWAEGYAESRTALSVREPGRVEGIEIRLAPWRTLRGRVVDADGRPVAGAKVRCFPLVRPETQSARDGSFTLTGLPEHPRWLSLGVEAEGFARARRELREGEIGEQELVLTLERGLDVQGVVCDAAGRGLPGASLYVGSSAFDVDTLRTVAGDEGRFLFRGVPRAARSLHAELAGYAPADVALELPQQGPLAPLRLELGTGGACRGIAVDAQGAPIAGLSVVAQRDEEYVEGARSTTGVDGRFVVEHLPTTGALALELYGKGWVRRQVAIDARSVDELRIVVTRAAGLAGRVLDAATGAPVTAFRVRLVQGELQPGEQPLSGYDASWIQEGREFRDPEGRWGTGSEELAPDQVTGIEVRATGYGPAFCPHAITRADPAAAPIEIRLTQGALVRGRVLDKKLGTPLAGAQVRRIAARNAQGSWFPAEADASETTRTDARGEFAFEGLPQEPLTLAVDAPGFAPALEGPFEPGPGLRTIELSGGATLRGQLLDGAGKPIAGAEVLVSAGGGSMGKLMRSWGLATDEQGRFELADLMPATYSAARALRHEHGAVYDLGQSVTILDAGSYSLELRPRGSARLDGTLQLGSAAAPLVTVQANRAGSTGWRAALARDGQFTLEGLEPGHWQISAYEHGSPQSARRGSAEIDVVEGQHATVSIEMR